VVIYCSVKAVMGLASENAGQRQWALAESSLTKRFDKADLPGAARRNDFFQYAEPCDERESFFE
jgi:hypothetical protein